jgi:hypothetical protein
MVSSSCCRSRSRNRRWWRLDDDQSSIQLATCNHHGVHIASGQPRDDDAVTGLFLSRKMPGHFFWPIRPGHVAEPDRPGKREIRDTGVWGLSQRESLRWVKRHAPGLRFSDLGRARVDLDRPMAELRYVLASRQPV